MGDALNLSPEERNTVISALEYVQAHNGAGRYSDGAPGTLPFTPETLAGALNELTDPQAGVSRPFSSSTAHAAAEALGALADNNDNKQAHKLLALQDRILQASFSPDSPNVDGGGPQATDGLPANSFFNLQNAALKQQNLGMTNEAATEILTDAFNLVVKKLHDEPGGPTSATDISLRVRAAEERKDQAVFNGKSLSPAQAIADEPYLDLQKFVDAKRQIEEGGAHIIGPTIDALKIAIL